MSAQHLHRLAVLALVLLSLVTAVSTRSSHVVAGPQANDLVVHEWGTFTSVSSREGAALTWRPLSVESDLPSFVYSIDKGNAYRTLHYPSKSGDFYNVRMETPVLFFYTKEALTASVYIGFPSGRITEWYPQASEVRRGYHGGGIRWEGFKVLPRSPAAFQNDGTRNHYYPARATDAAPVQVRGSEKTEHEKFLFYRGVGDFGLPLGVKVRGDKVVVMNRSDEAVGRAILFENRGGRLGYTIRDAPTGETEFARPVLDQTLDGLLRELRAQLISHGLYEKEADAMLNTWRDSWFEEGLRVFYVMPRKYTDGVIPLRIDPEPAQLVRVLVGRNEIISPEMERNVVEQVAKLDDGSESVRGAAMKEIKRYGRFTETVLQQAYEHADDVRVKTRVKRLMEEMARATVRPN